MSIDARLNKLMPALTAKERAILILRALREKTPENPSWRSTMPSDQTREFNRLIVLMNACNIYLPMYITMIELRAQEMWVRTNWWSTTFSLGKALWTLGELMPAWKHRAAEKAMEEVYPLVELPWVAEQHPHSWINVAEAMETTIKACVAHLWDEVNAIDVILTEVAVEFGGEDPLRPYMRGVLETARRDLALLHEWLSGEDAVKVTTPSEDAIEVARTYLDKGMRLMERV